MALEGVAGAFIPPAILRDLPFLRRVASVVGQGCPLVVQGCQLDRVLKVCLWMLVSGILWWELCHNSGGD